MEGKTPLFGDRRVGARLLPQVPEPASRVPRGDLERRRLGRRRRAARRCARVVGPARGTAPAAVRPARNPPQPGARSAGCGQRGQPSPSGRIGTHPMSTELPSPEAPTPSDADLIERVADGEREAFEELYRRYARAVLGLALRRHRRPRPGRGRGAGDVRRASGARPSSYDPRAGRERRGSTRSRATPIVDVAAPVARPSRDPPEVRLDRGRARRGGRGVWNAWRVHRALEASPSTSARDRPRLLLRPLAERDRRLPADSRSVP